MKLDALAATAGTTRSTMVRRLLDSTSGAPAPVPMPTEAELLQMLAAKARDGSVSAALALLKRAEPICAASVSGRARSRTRLAPASG